MTLGSCYTCAGAPPICAECFGEALARWSDSARTFGWRWGAGMRVTLDDRGVVPKSWPEWESDEAVNVRRICTRIVAPFASHRPERRDPRLVAAFARVCAEAAREAYSSLTIDEARLLVADFDRRLPSWRSDVARRIRDDAA